MADAERRRPRYPAASSRDDARSKIQAGANPGTFIPFTYGLHAPLVSNPLVPIPLNQVLPDQCIETGAAEARITARSGKRGERPHASPLAISKHVQEERVILDPERARSAGERIRRQLD